MRRPETGDQENHQWQDNQAVALQDSSFESQNRPQAARRAKLASRRVASTSLAPLTNKHSAFAMSMKQFVRSLAADYGTDTVTEGVAPTDPCLL